jgi:hypothetical protein
MTACKQTDLLPCPYNSLLSLSFLERINKNKTMSRINRSLHGMLYITDNMCASINHQYKYQYLIVVLDDAVQGVCEIIPADDARGLGQSPPRQQRPHISPGCLRGEAAQRQVRHRGSGVLGRGENACDAAQGSQEVLVLHAERAEGGGGA